MEDQDLYIKSNAIAFTNRKLILQELRNPRMLCITRKRYQDNMYIIKDLKVVVARSFLLNDTQGLASALGGQLAILPCLDPTLPPSWKKVRQVWSRPSGSASEDA
jgi:hypothetical protein